MVFSLLVLSPLGLGEAGVSALRFARAAVAQGHVLRQVFFHASGVAALNPPQAFADEPKTVAAWMRFAQQHEIPLLACETSAMRRGIEPRGGGPVRVGTLGQFMVAVGESDRIMSFAD